MDQNGRFEIPGDMRVMAQASFEQVRKTFDGLLAAAERAAASLEDQTTAAQAGVKEVAGKALGFVENNVRSSLDYAERLLKAKDVSEVMRLHADYVQEQMRAFADQAGEISHTVTRAAMDAAKPKS